MTTAMLACGKYSADMARVSSPPLAYMSSETATPCTILFFVMESVGPSTAIWLHATPNLRVLLADAALNFTLLEQTRNNLPNCLANLRT